MTYTDWSTTPPAQPPRQSEPTDWTPRQPRKKGVGTKVLAIGGSVVGAGVVALAGLTGFFGPPEPEIGNCVTETGQNTWDVVDCGSNQATYKVIGVDDEQLTFLDFKTSTAVCSSFATAKYTLWVGPDGGLGTVYCAEPLHASSPL
jgi:hypothetical protein